jgi:hypothetical protein
MRRPATLAGIVPEDQTVIFTLTAPIKLPAKTAAAIEGLVRDGLTDSEVRNTTHGNHVRLRRVAGVPAEMPRVVGFVHNPEADASLILALAEARLLAAISTLASCDPASGRELFDGSQNRVIG